MFRISPGQKFETAEDVAPHLKGLENGVTEANFGGSTYDVGACKAIADRLAEVKTLEIANFDDMFTGRDEIPESMEHLLSAVVNHPSLHTVNLSDNAFGIATIEPLEKFLAQHVPLEHLILANNGLGPQAGSRIGAALEELAARKGQTKTAPKLVTVVCGRNRLENGSMEAWARFIKAHGSIEELRLYQNGIRQEGIETLMREGLAHAPALRRLDLQDNTFTDRGSTAMADVLPKWSHIEEICISDCLLGTAGSLAIAQELEHGEPLKNLEVLKLQYDEIDEKGLQALYGAIEKNIPNLQLIELNGNRFSEDAGFVQQLNLLFSARGHGEIDELDDMEESEYESEEDVDSELEAGAPRQYAEDEPADVESDSEVAELAKAVAKTEIE